MFLSALPHLIGQTIDTPCHGVHSEFYVHTDFPLHEKDAPLFLIENSVSYDYYISIFDKCQITVITARPLYNLGFV